MTGKQVVVRSGERPRYVSGGGGKTGGRTKPHLRGPLTYVVTWPMAYDAPCGGSGRYARPA
eukprot:2964237-Prymnesium_polylepis.1